MRINIIINDETIRNDIKEAIETLEENEEIYFEFESEKTGFIDDCLDEICTKYETLEAYSPNYENEVLDLYSVYF